jgi:hypothetical protein
MREPVSRSYVAYHNEQKMKCPLWSSVDTKDFGFLTNKLGEALIGCRVWGISGKGNSPKVYVLAGYFDVKQVDEVSATGYKYVVHGPGRRSRVEPVLNDLAWFPAFRQSMANFSLGLQQIGDERVVEALTALMES